MEKQSGSEGLKRSSAANSVASLLTGLKSVQWEQKMRNNSSNFIRIHFSFSLSLG